MSFEQLYETLTVEDLEWVVPLGGGVLVLVGALLVGVVRGMTSGVLVAVFFGGLLTVSPLLLGALDRTERRAGGASPEVVRGAAELSLLNSEVVTDLSRVVATLRTALSSLAPIVEENGDGGDADPRVAQRFSQSLNDTAERLDVAIGSLERANALRDELRDDMDALAVELGGAPSAAAQ